jgi:pimeloyl-ACP methyl ester carboxylesterase
MTIRLSRRALRGLSTTAAVVAAGALAPAAGAQGGSAPGLEVDTVCFDVRNGSDRQVSTLFGQRYSVGKPPARTPAIVLVHGVASSTANWDFTPRLSVARSLARAGFVVISYDRLGFARSRYRGSGGGTSITMPNQRDMLHQLVTQVRRGRYKEARGSSCARTTTARPPANRRVVVVGHSAGGAIVQGYPGRYRDVAAVVQAAWSNLPPLSGAPAPAIPPGVGPQLVAGAQSIDFFANRQECESFNAYPPGAVASAVRIACDPENFVKTPAGEFLSFAQLQTENAAAIKATGRTPVLLTWADHDYIFPPDAAAADYKYWVDNCAGCDVTSTSFPRTGHLFMVHESLPDWVTTVTAWLRSRGLQPPDW